MQEKSSGMNYAPRSAEGTTRTVCETGEFPLGVVGLDHGHIYGMCNGLVEAGANVKLVYDPDPAKVDAFLRSYPDAQVARSEDEVLEDHEVRMVASASVPVRRAGLGIRAMKCGKDFFADKPPCTTREQLDRARATVAETGRFFAVYYSERLHVEASVMAERLIAEGAIGRVVQVINIAPHRMSLSQRPAWFVDPTQYGGILVDIGSHQIEQFLYYTGARDARVVSSRVANYSVPQHPQFEDFGDATLTADTGAVSYLRVDWLNPDGLGAWGDGRMFVLGTEGYIEVRKYIDVARDPEGDQLYLVDQKGEHHLNATGKEGFPFFGRLIRDCLQRTNTAYDQALAFKAMELALTAQEQAEHIDTGANYGKE
ncbi:MAG: gfo/Idh/MocA family oxidoreductase [Spirochaetaceae bacterium]|nr:MAG: gfo/Idh/MocA family oxidoreductase [Spirochaetaceae bacterium]